MATREAACHCGQLRLEVEGDPFVVGICHCLACKRRTGSAFGMQAAFEPQQVRGRRPAQHLYANLRRGGQEAARLPLLPRLRLAGLLHGARRAGSDRRVGRLVRRPVLSRRRPSRDTTRVGTRGLPCPTRSGAGTASSALAQARVPLPARVDGRRAAVVFERGRCRTAPEWRPRNASSRSSTRCLARTSPGDR